MTSEPCNIIVFDTAAPSHQHGECQSSTDGFHRLNLPVDQHRGVVLCYEGQFAADAPKAKQ